MARKCFRRLAVVSVPLALTAAALGAGSPAAAASGAYGPGSSAWDAYYANPLDTATWRPFCAGAVAKAKVVAGIPVPACGPTGTTQIDTPLKYPYTAGGVASVSGFQCVELVQRYLYVAKHWGTKTGDGADMVRVYGAAHNVTPVANGSGKAPHVGDVISFSVMADFTDDNGLYPGHTAIVSASSVNSSGNGSIKILSQNWAGGAAVTQVTVTNWTVQPITTGDANGVPVSAPYVEWLPTGTRPLGPPPPAVTGLAPPGSSPHIDSAACASVTSCTAVGFSVPAEPLLVTGSAASWKAASAPLPATANLGGQLYSVACPSSSACTAVGYADGSAGQQGLLETGSGKSWTAAEAPVPANAQTPAQPTLAAVACYSATSCAAAGSYDPTNDGAGLLETGSGTSWTPAEAPLPVGTGPGWGAQLTSVACPSATACVAAGWYNNPVSGVELGLIETGWGTSWTPAEAPLPANAALDPSVALFAVACHSAGSCVLVGQYNDSSGNTDGLILTGWGTSWQATEAPLPAGAAGALSSGLSSVACPSATWCVAASSYSDSPGDFRGALVTGSGTSWKATKVPLPANTQTPASAPLYAVACHSAASCLGVGLYRDSSGNYQGLLENKSGTSWKPAEAPLPASSGPPAELDRVACPSTTVCVAFGQSQGDLLVETGL